jgi:ArsR family metal-binding transcriptional regulator
MIIQRIYKIRRIAKVDTQKIRENMLLNLQELFTLAKEQAQNKKLALPQRQKWVRVASYVAQVINSLTKSFDEAQVTKDLERLEKLINEAMAKEKGGRTKAAS